MLVSFILRPGDSLTVTEPSSGTVWHLHSANLVKWQSVSTDPESVEIRIVNNNPSAYPTGFTRTVKDGINTADNKFTVQSLPGLKPGRGYQVNVMSSAGTILAQSAQFSINGTEEANATSVVTHSNSPTVSQPTLASSATNTSVSASSDAAMPTRNYIGPLTAMMLLVGGVLHVQS